MFNEFVQERLTDKDIDVGSSLVNCYPKLNRVEKMTCVALICLCDETFENLNLNVMTEDNGEDDDESLTFKKIFSYGATKNKTVTLYSTA